MIAVATLTHSPSAQASKPAARQSIDSSPSTPQMTSVSPSQRPTVVKAHSGAPMQGSAKPPPEGASRHAAPSAPQSKRGPSRPAKQ